MENLVLGSKENPIKCEGPSGERAYLNRLVGPDNQFLTYKRKGSRGRGPAGNILDRYVLQSLDGSFEQEIYFDMYWTGYEEKEAPPLFSFIPEIQDNSQTEFSQVIKRLEELRDKYGDSECNRFGYIWSKTNSLSQLGPMFYASQDAFGMPSKDFALEEIVRCCRDLSEKLHGTYRQLPLQFSSKEVAKQFFMTLHFVVELEELSQCKEEQVQLLKTTHKMMQDEMYIWIEISPKIRRF